MSIPIVKRVKNLFYGAAIVIQDGHKLGLVTDKHLNDFITKVTLNSMQFNTTVQPYILRL